MYRGMEVHTLDGFRLQVAFSDGVSGTVDLSHLVGRGVFRLWDDQESPGRFMLEKEDRFPGATASTCVPMLYTCRSRAKRRRSCGKIEHLN